jgi:hypothetical protein
VVQREEQSVRRFRLQLIPGVRWHLQCISGIGVSGIFGRRRAEIPALQDEVRDDATMRLQQWTSIAEIVSGIAVVITLVVLIAGIRENNSLIRATMYTDRIESINAFSLAIAQDADLGRMWQAYVDEETDSLSAEDRPRLVNLLQTLLRTYETAWYARDAGFIGDAEWTRFDGSICTGYNRSQATGFNFDIVLTDQFVEFLSEACLGESN